MNIHQLALISAVSSALGTQLKAQDDPWLIWGIGNTRCTNYSEVQSSNDNESATRLRDAVFIWATGFFSGMNLLSEEPTVRDLSDESVSRAALEARLLGRCFEAPEAMLVEVLATIYFQIPTVQSNDKIKVKP